MIDIASKNNRYEELVKFLLAARLNLREAVIESELLFGYAKIGKLTEMEDFITSPNLANISDVGDRCFKEGMYEPARILFSSVSNWAKLATTLVKLGEYQAAVDSARKANSTKVWKDVHAVCVENKEFKLAQICGLNLIVHADELEVLNF